ncbi:MAG: nuclear transport factor 2 family protein [Solirubrobacterales bacterium]|nr:nuclear transport factor 2 family protein [Solirubrobacterales bacterium]MBV9717103.1 nuclear transport factor 2 family protein [Solirubrobacterales bacterium]
MSATTSATFDLDRFTRAAEARDAATQLSMYGPEATVTIANKLSQPRTPRVLRGREEIKAWLEDMYGRDMTHKVKHRVKDDTGVAYTQACRYPDGTNVLCATVIALAQGAISSQTVLEVWDES